MRKFITNLLIFLFPVVIPYCLFALFILPELFKIAYGPNTKQQIEYSFENAIKSDYDMLVLGNSRCYRGINPDVFKIKTYNFSHDADTYNQMYYKLKYLGTRHKFNYLILGVDYFQFSFISDKRNYIYGPLLGSDYLHDYNSDNVFFDVIKQKLVYLNPDKLKQLKFNTGNKPFIKSNGQYIKYGKAKKDNFKKRKISRLKIQIEYFQKILEYCSQKRIVVFMVTPPTRENELRNYSKSDLIQFNSFIKECIGNKATYILNFSTDTTFTINDYTDITHLNEKAADKFSKKLNDTIVNLIKLKQIK